MGLGWIDPRTPALRLQAPMRLGPGWRLSGVLLPMDQGSLIAPLWEPSHDPAMHRPIA